MVYVIAEIGNNHEGRLELAMKSVSAAKEAGADAVKLQAIIPHQLVNQKIRAERVESLRKLCLSLDEIEKVYKFSKTLKLDFGVSFFDIESCLKLKHFDFAKVASSDCDNLKLLETITRNYKNVFISTGMLDSYGVRRLKKNLMGSESNVTVMHCISKYPTTIWQANLNFIDLLKANFRSVGYSDHTDIIDVSLMALAKGCCTFEKHFTLDKNMTGIRDHKLSSNPKEFREYCNKLKTFDKALGSLSFDNRPDLEDDTHLESKQSYYLRRNVLRGESLSTNDLVYQRPRQKAGIITLPKGKNLLVKNNLKIGDLLKKNDID